MDEMTQQNAALAEESAASAGALTGQIETLNQLVAAFRTRGGQRVAAGGGMSMPAPRASAPAPAAAMPRAARPAPRPAPAARQAADAAPSAPSAGNEPDRLRRLAAEAFAAPAPKPAAKAASAPRRAAPATSGWEEF
jgi:methyl-accepting chemotaxis protein